jgi:hypothetical protein
MQIQNINHTNFKGAYVFPGMPTPLKAELETIIPHGKVIYHNPHGKMYLVTKNLNIFKTKMAEFIKNNGLKCKYYPNIHTGMDFKLGHPEKLIEVLKNETPEEIVYDENLLNAIETKRRKEHVKNNSSEYISNILNTLGFDIDRKTLKTKFGAKIFKNTNNTKNIVISPRDENKLHYVKVDSLVSDSNQDSRRMYAMTSEGKILRDYTHDIDNWKTFHKKFNDTLIK